MRVKVTALSITLIVFSVLLHGQEVEVTTKDGRTVILKQDGTWELKRDKITSTIANEGNSLDSFNSKLPFNSFAATTITSRFRGHDVNEIHEILTKRFEPKDEFETTANYENRIAAAKPYQFMRGFRSIPG